jgi:beta-galactosidase
MKLPGLAAEMCGVAVDETIAMPADGSNAVQFSLPELGNRFPTTALADVLECSGAQVIARHVHDFYAGRPAVTLNLFGQGKVIYLGALSDGAHHEAVARWISGLAGVQPLLETPAGVEVAERWQGEQRLLFILNHNPVSQNVGLPSNCVNLLDEKPHAGTVSLEPYGVMVLQALD